MIRRYLARPASSTSVATSAAVGRALAWLGVLLPLLTVQPTLRAEPDAHAAQGNYRASAKLAGKPVELHLKSGFSVKLRATADWQSTGAVTLQVAKIRVKSADIYQGFVPIGPTVQLSAAPAQVEARFLAERFRVRQGHRLVLAYEVSQACTGSSPCTRWLLREAKYEQMRCVATGVPANGLRLQFGSIPAS